MSRQTGAEGKRWQWAVALHCQCRCIYYQVLEFLCLSPEPLHGASPRRPKAPAARCGRRGRRAARARAQSSRIEKAVALSPKLGVPNAAPRSPSRFGMTVTVAHLRPHRRCASGRRGAPSQATRPQGRSCSSPWPGWAAVRAAQA